MKKAVLLLAALGLAGALWAADPFVGTWKLNAAKSKTTDATILPTSEIIKSEGIDNGLNSTIDLERGGNRYHLVVLAKYDGNDYPIIGDPSAGTFALRKIDATTLEMTLKNAEQETAKYRAVISRDGKTLTLTGKGMNSKGQEFSVTAVYDKQ